MIMLTALIVRSRVPHWHYESYIRREGSNIRRQIRYHGLDATHYHACYVIYVEQYLFFKRVENICKEEV